MIRICMIFQIHQPYRLRNFHFFEIGGRYSYFDEEKNAKILRRVAESSYLPANLLLQDLITIHGNRIKISLAISGTVMDQMEAYAPEVLESFQQLVATGNVELLAQPYSTSLSSLKNKFTFINEVAAHKKRVYALFHQRPNVFFNTGLIYSDAIGKMIGNLGFKATITAGAPKILEEESPNFIYQSASLPSLKLLFRHPSLSDDISERFSHQNWSEWPLTSDKFIGWLKGLPSSDQVVNLVMDYAVFGEKHKKESGIFDFLKHLLKRLASEKDFKLTTPKEILILGKVAHKNRVIEPISWSGTQKDLSVWCQNDMQKEAIERVYALENKLKKANNKALLKDWEYLKSADHFLYMNGANGYNPYESPYDGFLKYMNVLSDLELKVKAKIKSKSAVLLKKHGKQQEAS